MKRPLILGLDLGTSSIKALLLDVRGVVISVGRSAYPIDNPRPGWAEQDPETWWNATRKAVSQATARYNPADIVGIGISGQMHGMVLVKRDGKPVYPAVIWADRRSEGLIAEFRARLSPDELEQLANPIVVGFTGPTLFWFQKYQPQLLRDADWVMQPKDWLRLRLTNTAFAEKSDASATLLFDVRRRVWAKDIITALGLPLQLFLDPLDSGDCAGALTRQTADALGLRTGTPVAAGAADQAAAALANGILEDDALQLSLGSGGQLLRVTTAAQPDPHKVTHLFCHALPGYWYRMGATLNVGLALDWVRRSLGLTWTGLFRLSATGSPGAHGLTFLPYLLGERTPHMDPTPMSAWVGLSYEHTRTDLARAALEGVSFSIREALAALDSPVSSSARLTGGGARNQAWVQLLSDVLGRSLAVPQEVDSSAWGAALLGGVASGLFSGDAAELQQYTIRVKEEVTPRHQEDTNYDRAFYRFQTAYRRLRGWPEYDSVVGVPE